MNSAAPWPGLLEARARVLDHQRKLHRWARQEPARRFDDLFNLVCDRATLKVAWDRVSRNKGAKTAGIDGATRSSVEHRGVEPLLEELRSSLRNGSFEALPVRERLIPKKGGQRRLGIPTLRDRVAQMALKLVLEPIFEADFYPSSYGYRPSLRAQDAIAEVHHFTREPSSYEWVIEGDIKACFDTVDHRRLMTLVGERVADRRVFRLVRAFLRAGVMQEHGGFAASPTGTPQGGIVSPLLANVYLSVLDRAFEADWVTGMATPRRRARRRAKGLPTYRLVRYADDFLVLLKGSKEQAEALKARIAALVTTELGMTLSIEKTHVTHVDDGFDFLGFRIKRVPRGHGRSTVYTYPSKESLAAVMRKIKQATSRRTLGMTMANVLRKINPILRGWAAYFRHAASSRTFSYLSNYAWIRMIRWIRMKHPSMTRRQARAQFYGADRIAEDGVVLFNPAKTTVERYRFRGTKIDTPYTIDEDGPKEQRLRAAYDEGTVLGAVCERLSLNSA